jgi:hypothetical protein
MSLFDPKYLWRYATIIAILGIATFFGNQFKKKFANSDEEDYELVKMYLLNDSPLYGNNKPKLWIHSKYEVNARKWRDFQSRNTTDVNQPYLNITVQSIIQHCADDFHILLIDDTTFEKLVPGWEIKMNQISDPYRTQFRQVGFAKLIYLYGGMVVPNSFLCTSNMKTLFDEATEAKSAFVGEQINRACHYSNDSTKKKDLFVPDPYILGAKEKEHPTIGKYLDYLISRALKPHSTNEYEFVGDVQHWCKNAFSAGELNVVDGELIGIKTYRTRKPILLEDLLEEKVLDLALDHCGVYLPADDILKRTKYQWFAVMSTEEIARSRLAVAKYMRLAMVDETARSTEKKSCFVEGI